jgi:predicted divalent heavy-metal cations transporter
MYGIVAKGLLIPFLGTSLGAILVFFMKSELKQSIQSALTGFSLMIMLDVALG